MSEHLYAVSYDGGKGRYKGIQFEFDTLDVTGDGCLHGRATTDDGRTSGHVVCPVGMGGVEAQAYLVARIPVVPAAKETK